MLTSLAVSVCMMISSFACGNVAYGAEAPAGDDNFNYNGYSATQLKKISECISGVIPESECPSYEASSKDYYTGTVNHVNMPTGVISTKAGWLQWADAAMKANSYDGVYGTLRIAPGGAAGTTSSTTGVSDVRFRLIGINQDNRADGTGKAGLTFQVTGYYSIMLSNMNNSSLNSNSYRDALLRKNLNDKSTGTIWNTIASNDFKQNIIPVLKMTNNAKRANISSLSATVDKLWILSPSEMGLPVIRNYNVINEQRGYLNGDANVHYFDMNSYSNTIKSSNDGNIESEWHSNSFYIYVGNIYQWWMLPAGSRIMSNGNQAYHNTDSYSYCAIGLNRRPSGKECWNSHGFWFRSPDTYDIIYENSIFSYFYYGSLHFAGSVSPNGVILAFSL